MCHYEESKTGWIQSTEYTVHAWDLQSLGSMLGSSQPHVTSAPGYIMPSSGFYGQPHLCAHAHTHTHTSIIKNKLLFLNNLGV